MHYTHCQSCTPLRHYFSPLITKVLTVLLCVGIIYGSEASRDHKNKSAQQEG